MPSQKPHLGTIPHTFCIAALLFGGILTETPPANAGGGASLWTNYYNGPGNGSDFATAIAVSPNGNVIVAGNSTGVGGLYTEYAIIAYSADGSPLWTNRYNGPGNGRDEVTDIAVGTDGRVFVTGYSEGLPAAPDYATVAYSNTGQPLWTNRYNRGIVSNDRATAIACDTNGNVFVTGYSLTNNGYYYTTLKYSSDGTPVWTNHYALTPDGDSEAYALAVTPEGKAFVTGRSLGFDTISYSEGGVALWTNKYNYLTNEHDWAMAIALDSNRNVFVTGHSATTAVGSSDIATVAYSEAGEALWTNRLAGRTNGMFASSYIAVDTNGDVFVAGSMSNTNGFEDFQVAAYSNQGLPLWTNRFVNGAGCRAIAVDAAGNVFLTGNDIYYHFLTVAYSSVGELLWTNRFIGPGNGNDYARAMAVDGAGNVYVTGESRGSGNGDFATVKYASSVPIHAHLAYQRVGNWLMLTWTNADFGLLSAPAVTSTFTNIPGAFNPYWTPITGAQKYFRLKKN
jgi:uncharacterized delta-60 repeat protein